MTLIPSTADTYTLLKSQIGPLIVGLEGTTILSCTPLGGSPVNTKKIECPQANQEICQLLEEGVRRGGVVPEGFSIDDQGPTVEWAPLFWEQLRAIPVGRTLTYRQFALLTTTKASYARAVASRLSRNRIAIFNPCHRILPSHPKNSVGGYRWGSEIKQKLISLERQLIFTSTTPSPSPTL